MKHIKIYENKDNEPQIGEYAIGILDGSDDKFNSYISNSIGKIVNRASAKEEFRYIIEYVLPDNLYSKVFQCTTDDEDIYIKDNIRYILCYLLETNIIEHSSTKQELEAKIASKKYNL